ncbi:DUF3592 domain-containing protein [Paucibacter sp. M5-1]|uniref:DUF3592 domain-containing protein n=1 Tax=Paucibacter sp. M5-1 TaxID=3015998 RepID=UPI0022B87B29|nr:DUF3592 domain-containing protein [Paucibacter sp. M5-1]MCZ7880233.1 hypothetical protein [Paucibacter sp. M5-1]
MKKVSPWMFWGFVPLSIVPLLHSVPSTYEQLVHERRVKQYGAVVSGLVVGHEQLPGGGRGCRSRVTVAYEVAKKRYELASTVCGASLEALPVGQAIDVRYISGSPARAMLSAPRVDASADGWRGLAIQLGIPLALGWLGWVARKRQRESSPDTVLK